MNPAEFLSYDPAAGRLTWLNSRRGVRAGSAAAYQAAKARLRIDGGDHQLV